ncbi:PREDICTED: UPF0481 protein At3g47200-like [Nelumbo nucifera]|uniref:UPF0481 protein At3g47200-like n=2 Tax=Nelumbo nucifera TaxID=4432 RepID=A0A1U7ZJQ7_NELNU|nr:PREDICTED: UPF0481 protein At3g47200-like [Nelumbo nucifera]DAD46282.1 TPA_asm: hypothetical protein HUJ06_004512 [Nelumbo nucifera]
MEVEEGNNADAGDINEGNNDVLCNKLADSTLRELDGMFPMSGNSSSSLGSECSIHRVPNKFYKGGQNYYVPELVAIGPYYHGDERFINMEVHKQRYVHALLGRISTPESRPEKLKALFEVVGNLEEKVRESYSSDSIIVNEEKKDDFRKMILFDGLFIVELLLRSEEPDTYKKDPNDPIFNTSWMYASLVRDMILLENQLPLFILEKLFSKMKEFDQNSQNKTITRLALRFFKTLIPNDQEILSEGDGKFAKTKHLLDVLYKVLFDVECGKATNSNSRGLSSAVKLERAGVRFKKADKHRCFLDIKFKHEALEIPVLHIEDHFEVFLRNLIAWEQCSNIKENRPFVVTSYAFLMESMINTESDVELLCRREIITHSLGCDEDVSLLFNNLCKEVTLEKFFYSEVCEQVEDYSKTLWHTWREWLTRKYFRSPWACMSLFTAMLLLLFAFVGAVGGVFSALSYLFHKS